MRNWMKQHPPYEGEQPYLYLAFANTDQARVRKIMKLLLERGCRVWYCCGLPGSAAEVLRRQERSGGAALTVLYLTDAAAADRDTKSNVLVNQKFDRPILCLDPDGTDRRLSMGLHETVPHIPLYTLTGSADMENAIIHADGFSQEILGEPVRLDEGALLRKLTVVFSALAVLIALISFAGIRYLHWFQPELPDEVTIRDPVILSAVRDAAGGGVITEELTLSITHLRLDSLPESWEDLASLPALEGITLPQQSLIGEGELPEGDYDIELIGGEEG